MRKSLYYAVLFLLAAALSGCFGAAPWGGDRDADLVVISRNRTPVYSIAVDWDDQGMAVRNAGRRALLERGESFGLALETQRALLTVTLSGESGRTLARTRVDYSGTRLFLTLEEDGGVRCGEER